MGLIDLPMGFMECAFKSLKEFLNFCCAIRLIFVEYKELMNPEGHIRDMLLMSKVMREQILLKLR